MTASPQTPPPAPPEGFTLMRSNSAFMDLVGPLYLKREGERFRIGFVAEARHDNGNGVVHGGMLTTVVDYVFGFVVWRAAGKRPLATVALNTEFVGPAREGDWLEVEAEITRRTRTLVFIRGALRRGDEPVMTAAGIWKLLGEP